MTLRRLCRQYNALPSQVLAEDGGLLLQLLEVDGILAEAEAERQREERGWPTAMAGGGEHGGW